MWSCYWHVENLVYDRVYLGYHSGSQCDSLYLWKMEEQSEDIGDRFCCDTEENVVIFGFTMSLLLGIMYARSYLIWKKFIKEKTIW